jgi:Domain of unknown function (DUF4331)
MRKMKWLQGAIALAIAAAGPLAFAADHRDSPAAVAEPAADINDVYAWAESEKVILAMTVFPVATAESKFSDAIQYALHVESSDGYGMPGSSKDVICTFDAAQKIQCWVGDAGATTSDDYVTGDASATAGITSTSGKVKVFAGLRADPFYFNLDGFRDTVATVKAAAPSLMFDADGCPQLDAATSGVLIGQLQGTMSGAQPAANFFETLNTLSIVIELDKSLLTGGGSTLAVWASTHQK